MTRIIQLAVQNVIRNRRRSGFVFLTVFFGAVSLMLFTGYILATTQAIKESIIRGGTGHFQIAMQGGFDGYEEQQLQYGMTPQRVDELVSFLQRQSAVRQVVTRLNFSGLISNGNQTLTFQGTGTAPENENRAFGLMQRITAGQPLSGEENATYEILLGKELARRLGVQLGDNVTLLSTTIHGAINALDVQVRGIVSTGNPDSERYLVKVPLRAAQTLLRSNKISLLSVLMDPDNSPEELVTRLHQRDGQIEIRSWRQLVPLYDQLAALYRDQFTALGLIIGIVVFLSVATMTLTSILERRREIGTLRAMGISAGYLRMLFMTEGSVLGFFGGVCGTGVGMLLMNVLNQARLVMPPPPGRNTGVLLHFAFSGEASLMIIAVMILLCGLAAMLISRRITRLNIVEALAVT